MILDIERKYPIKVDVKSYGCWEPTSHKPKHDGRYFQIGVMDEKTKEIKPTLMHRYVYETLVESIPEGYIVRHTCDNVLCVNPEHLKMGTHQDNSNDMVERGRVARGEKVASSKLTDQEVDEIRDLYNNTSYTQNDIGNFYGVSQRQISNIVRYINR